MHARARCLSNAKKVLASRQRWFILLFSLGRKRRKAWRAKPPSVARLAAAGGVSPRRFNEMNRQGHMLCIHGDTSSLCGLRRIVVKGVLRVAWSSLDLAAATGGGVMFYELMEAACVPV